MTFGLPKLCISYVLEVIQGQGICNRWRLVYSYCKNLQFIRELKSRLPSSRTVPRQTGQDGCSVELAVEGCECSMEPVYCISTVKNMWQVSSCMQRDKQLGMKYTLLMKVLTIQRTQTTIERQKYLKRWKSLSIEMIVKKICWVLTIHPDQNSVAILRPLCPEFQNNKTVMR